MALPVTSEMIERAAARLAEGGWRYTTRQLYYATCAAAETPRSRSTADGEIAFGILLALVALILISFRIVFFALMTLAVLLIVAGVVSRSMRRPAGGRVLAISMPAFQALAATAATGALSGTSIPGRGPYATGGGPLIVCDTADTAAAVAANAERAGITSADVRSAADLPERLDGQRAIALHDASPHGCALPLALRDAGADVFDAGLRPSWVDDQAVQVLEGAPARLPRDLSSTLSSDEIDWLLSGRRVELAVLPPERLMRVVTTAIATFRESKEGPGTLEGEAHPDATGSGAPGLLPSLPYLP